MEDEIELMKKPSIGKILFNVCIVSATILVLGFVINLYYAVGYLFILIVHELGHYIVAKFLNIKVRFGGFTPFGAYIVHENTKSCKENAIIAIGGPLFGGLLGLIYYIIYHFTGESTFLVLSFTSIILNLMNLIPVSPLDGGKIVEAISPIICYMGFPFLLYLFISANRLKTKILLLFIMVVGIYETYNFTIKYKKDSYFKLDRKSKIKFISIYSILLLSLGVSAIYFYNTFNFKELIKSITRFK